LKGFADIHNHQFSYLGFGGVAFHGRAFNDLAQALPWCDFIPGSLPLIPIHGPGGSRDIMGNIVRTQILHLPASALFGYAVGGYPAFDGWPR